MRAIRGSSVAAGEGAAAAAAEDAAASEGEEGFDEVRATEGVAVAEEERGSPEEVDGVPVPAAASIPCRAERSALRTEASERAFLPTDLLPVSLLPREDPPSSSSSSASPPAS